MKGLIVLMLMKRVLSVCVAALVLAAFSSVALAVDCDHANAQWVQTAAPACSALGEKELQCPDCLETLEVDVIPALPHRYGPWVIVDPGEQGFLFNRPIEGRQEATCTVCGHTISNVYDPGKVNLAENWTCEHWTWKHYLMLFTLPVSLPVYILIALLRGR